MLLTTAHLSGILFLSRHAQIQAFANLHRLLLLMYASQAYRFLGKKLLCLERAEAAYLNG